MGYGGRGRLYTSILKDKHIEVEAICDTDKKSWNLQSASYLCPTENSTPTRTSFSRRANLRIFYSSARRTRCIMLRQNQWHDLTVRVFM